MRYYFDFSANGVESTDVFGVDLPDLESAEREAYGAVASIAREERGAVANADFAVTIRSADGERLSRVAARFTIETIAN